MHSELRLLAKNRNLKKPNKYPELEIPPINLATPNPTPPARRYFQILITYFFLFQVVFLQMLFVFFLLLLHLFS